jgi:hypothetical protein
MRIITSIPSPPLSSLTMKLRLVIFLFSFSSSFLFVRKEWRELSSKQQTELLDAINELKTRPSKDGNNNRYDDFAVVHSQHGIHNKPGFLPWHRLFTRKFEAELQISFPLPYWDYSIDSQAPEESIIWESFGNMGDPETCCVNTGAFAGWIASDNTCLKRSGEPKIAAFYSREQCATIISAAKTHEEFRQLFEPLAHGAAHLNIMGHMTTLRSPDDPVRTCFP